ncbi:MAG TPA: protein kinase, partial [Candidatus Nitrosotenuis sp.]|nr:protein kinase [Candidatus Nitrosotenuis sp.]
WGIQIADVLTYLHRHEPYPVVLGDMKPSNVMRDFNGAIKVVDFGVARYLAPSHNPRTFSLVSPGFSAPEQFTRFEVDTRSDIYALGATLYWVLTGVSLERYKFAIPPIRRVRSNISQLTEYVLGRCLKREPGERYVRASAVREELAKILAELQRKEKERQEQSSPDQILSALYERKRRLEGD